MSASRILLAPTHRTGAAMAIAAALAEIVGKQKRNVRYHTIGATCPAGVWDRWEGASFLDPGLYDVAQMVKLYEAIVRGADLSLLAAERGVLDAVDERGWTPADVARALDCPIVLVVDCRGWGAGLGGLVEGFRTRLGAHGLAGLLLTGLRDKRHREVIRKALLGSNVPVVGCIYEGDGPSWDSVAPGPWGVPLGPEFVEAVHRQVDSPGLEGLAGQRGFLAGASIGPGDRQSPDGPLVLVAGGWGFTPWSRDSIELLRLAGSRVMRLDLAHDERLPDETAGVIVAGHLWTDALPELAGNYSLMRDIRVRASEGMPLLALGGGMLYTMRRVQDERGRSFELAGLLPAEAEVVGVMEEPNYLDIEVKRDCLLFAEGERLVGWLATDAEIMEAPASRSYPFVVSAADWDAPLSEGAAVLNLLCSRVLVHLASVPQSTRRFVAACGRYRDSQ